MAGAGGEHLLVGVFLGRVGHQPVGVVVGGGVTVVGVEVEVHPGVPEVVLLPPPGAHPGDDLAGGQVGAGGQDVDLPGGGLGGGAALVGGGRDREGDLPHREHSTRPPKPTVSTIPGAVGGVVGVVSGGVQGQGDGGVRGPPGVFAAVFIADGQVGEPLGGDRFRGPFAPGEDVEPVLVEVGEQGRGPAAAVEPDQHPAVIADRGPQVRDQSP